MENGQRMPDLREKSLIIAESRQSQPYLKCLLVVSGGLGFRGGNHHSTHLHIYIYICTWSACTQGPMCGLTSHLPYTLEVQTFSHFIYGFIPFSIFPLPLYIAQALIVMQIEKLRSSLNRTKDRYMYSLLEII